MQLYRHYHALTKHRALHSDFHLFELSVWIHVFGRALISVFIPIFLLQLGYGVERVMLYYFIYCAFDIPLNFIARWSTRRWGARLTIAISTLSSILFFGVLFALGVGDWPLLILLAFFSAVYDALYWVVHIFLFMESSKKRGKTSKDTSSLSVVRQFGGLLAPAFGAGILIFFHQQALIITSTVFLALSVLPLLRAKDLPDKPSTPQPTFKQFFERRHGLRDYVTMSLYGVHGAAEEIIWPMFIFTLFASVESVAIIPIIASITTIIFTFFAGRIKEQHRLRAVTVGGVMIALVWLLRLVLASSFFYYGSIFLVGLFAVMILIPTDSNIYERGEKVDSLSASMYRNLFNMGSQAVLFGLLALLTNVFHVSFVLAGTSTIVIALLALMVGKTRIKTRV